MIDTGSRLSMQSTSRFFMPIFGCIRSYFSERGSKFFYDGKGADHACLSTAGWIQLIMSVCLSVHLSQPRVNTLVLEQRENEDGKSSTVSCENTIIAMERDFNALSK